MALSPQDIQYYESLGMKVGQPVKRKSLFKTPEIEAAYAQLDPRFRQEADSAPEGFVTSAVRSPEENSAVGGVPNSYHMKGMALDYRKTPNINEIDNYWKSKGFKTIDEGDHLHVEPNGDLPSMPSPQAQLSDDDKAYYKTLGFSYPGMEQEPAPSGMLDKIYSSLPSKQQALGVAGNAAENAFGPLDAARRMANTTASGILSPLVDMASAANPITMGEKAGAFVNEKLGLPSQTPISDFAQKGTDYLKGMLNEGMMEPATPWEQQTGMDFTAPPLAPYINAENAKAGAQKLIQTLGLPEDSFVGNAFEGAMGKASDALAGLVTPANIALMATGATPIGKPALASFIPGMAEQTSRGIGETVEGIKQGNPEMVGGGVAEALLGGLFTGGAMKGAFRGKNAPLEVKGEPLEFRDMPELPAPEAPLLLKGRLGDRVYTPNEAGRAFVSDKVSLKRDPFQDPKIKRVIESELARFEKERPVEEAPLMRKEKPLFPFIPEELAPEREVPRISVPESLRPREQVGFETEVVRPKVKVEETPYPSEFKAKVDEAQAWRSDKITVKQLKRLESDLSLKLAQKFTPERLEKVIDGSNLPPEAKQIFNPILERPVTKKEAIQYVRDVKQSIEQPKSMPFGAIKQKLSNIAAPLKSERGSIAATMPLSGPKILRQPAYEGMKSPEPIKGTGEMKARGLSEGVEAKAIENKLTKGFGDLPEYKTVNMREQSVMASELLAKDPGQAKRIAMGQESPPKGLIPESVFTAVENKAIKEGDINTVRELATASKLTSEATTMGQRIRSLAERDPESPIAAIQEVLKVREEVAMRRAGVKDLASAKKDIASKIKEEIKRNLPSKQSWTEFIDSIEC